MFKNIIMMANYDENDRDKIWLIDVDQSGN